MYEQYNSTHPSCGPRSAQLEGNDKFEKRSSYKVQYWDEIWLLTLLLQIEIPLLERPVVEGTNTCALILCVLLNYSNVNEKVSIIQIKQKPIGRN